MAKSKNAQSAQNEETKVLTAEEQALLDLEAQLEELKTKKKELKESMKGEKKRRELKGILVRFTNQKGEIIEGLGNLYYCVRMDGKLHYKASSDVHIMDEAEIAEYNARKKA